MPYILMSALLLTLFYGLFWLLLRRDTQHALNRAVLLLSLAASLALPAVHVKQTHPRPLLVREGSVYSHALNQTEKLITPLPHREGPGVGLVGVVGVVGMVGVVGLFFYFLGLSLMLVRFLWQLGVIMRSLRGGLHYRDREGFTIIIKGGDFACYSFFRSIVISADDYEQHGRTLLAHEKAHARLWHSLDLIAVGLMKAVQWFNPAVWLIGRDLQVIHEYQADEATIRQGIDAKRYQQLLVSKAVGLRLQTLASGFHHSPLKQRITMMKKEKTPRALALLKACALLPVVALSLMATAQTVYVEAPTADTPVRDDSLAFDPRKPMPKDANKRYQMAQYWLEQHMQYTDEMRRRGIGGNIMTQPYVKADGSHGDVKMDEHIDPLLRAEVMRLLQAMPKPLMKGLLPLTTREGYTWLTVAIYDPTLSHQPFNKRERLIKFIESSRKGKVRLPERFSISIPLGAVYSDKDGGHVITRHDLLFLNGAADDYFRIGLSTDARLMLNGVPFDKNSLPDLPADTLKEIILSDVSHYEGDTVSEPMPVFKERRTVNLITK